jgi:hypothetical protein
MMHKAVEVKARERYRIWIRFSDGVEGEADLSDLAGEGVFESWNDHEEFAKVFVDPRTHTVAWPGGIDLCPDSLYREIVEGQKAA